MSDRASEALAESFLPGEPRTLHGFCKVSYLTASRLYHKSRVRSRGKYLNGKLRNMARRGFPRVRLGFSWKCGVAELLHSARKQ